MRDVSLMKWPGMASVAALALVVGATRAGAQLRSEAVLGATLGRLRAAGAATTGSGIATGSTVTGSTTTGAANATGAGS